MRIQRNRQPSDIDWEIATQEELERFKNENAHLFYGDVYCGDNTKHAWLPFDYQEFVGNVGGSQDVCFEFSYVRLDKRIDPEQTPYGYCFFYPDEGILEFGNTHGEWDVEHDPLFELTLEGDFDELFGHMRLQFQAYEEKQNGHTRSVIRQDQISELGGDAASA